LLFARGVSPRPRACLRRPWPEYESRL
jgi:hypothetical protein